MGALSYAFVHRHLDAGLIRADTPDKDEVRDGEEKCRFPEFFSQFDMLCDGARNAAFDCGLGSAIARLRKDGSRVHVLDIGTGSGLLALLASRHCADIITAVECVPRLADAAEDNFRRNHAAVRLLRGSSRDLKSLSLEANLVVAELLDTGLLGEGVLPTLRHAAEQLLDPGFLAVPASTTVYAVLVRGAALRDLETVPELPETHAERCTGAASGISVHAQPMLDAGVITRVSPEFEVFSFDWAKPPASDRSVHSSVRLTSAGSVDGVLMWWVCREPYLSTAPGVYRADHWRQVIYTRCSSCPVIRRQLVEHLGQGELISVSAHHTSYEIWFDIERIGDIEESRSSRRPRLSAPLPPICSCGVHTNLSRRACWAVYASMHAWRAVCTLIHMCTCPCRFIPCT